jgi:Penicillin-insensitive murein endopeptidase
VLRALLTILLTAACLGLTTFGLSQVMDEDPASGQSEPPVSEPAPHPSAPPPVAIGVEQAEHDGIGWRRSTPMGRPFRGALFNGVQLPAEGEHFFTWDPIYNRVPNRPWRRWAADSTLRVLLRVIEEYRTAHPEAPRVAIGDLSRTRGGNFGPRFGKPGHNSHQNGLDIDLYYPRRDRLELGPKHPGQVDRVLSQDLVNRFVAAGAQYVFVGPRVRLGGPRKIVSALTLHDDHMHIRLFRRGPAAE